MRANQERTIEITAKVLNLDKAVIGRVYDEQIKIFTVGRPFRSQGAGRASGNRWWRWVILQQVPDDSAMFTTRFVPVKY